MRHAHHARRAFSLLEMVLALAIGMLLLLALYVAFDTYIGSAQSGREVVAQSALARNILTRIGNDINGQLGAADPRGADYSGATPDTSDTPPANGTPTPMSGAQTANLQNMVKFNLGISGKTNVLHISGYRIRKAAANAQANMAEEEVTSDLRSSIYWLVMSGPDSLGLAHVEIKQATSADVDVDPTALPDQEKYIIAKEVKKIEFEYFDGISKSWSGEWNGQATEGEGAPPTGPPAAIRITLTLKRYLNKTGAADPAEDGPTYQHIIALPTSNSFPQPSTTP